MKPEDFFLKAYEARKLDQKVLCFIRPTDSEIEMYFVRNILNPEVDLSNYDYEQVSSVEYSTFKFIKDNSNVISIRPISLAELISTSHVIDYGMNSNEIRDRFELYVNYFIKFFAIRIDVDMILRLYQNSIDTQRSIARTQLGITLNTLYNKISIKRISGLDQAQALTQCRSLKYNYIGFIYINIYTFDLFIQIHHNPNIDALIAGITIPDPGNFLVGICPGDSVEQLMSKYLQIQSDINPIITKEPSSYLN